MVFETRTLITRRDTEMFRAYNSVHLIAYEGLISEFLPVSIKEFVVHAYLHGLPSKIDFSQADFSLRLFRRLAKTGRSTVVSPFSIAVALAMINAGASGKTQKQLNDVLAKGVSSDAFNIYIKKLLKQLSKPLGGFQLNIATKLFVQKDLDMLKDYTSELHKDYASNVNEVDFQKPALVSQEINKWANKQLDNTSGKLVEAEMFPDATQMVVISIASFDGTWKKPFNDFASHNQTFFQTKAKRKKVILQMNNIPSMECISRSFFHFKYILNLFFLVYSASNYLLIFNHFFIISVLLSCRR
ncbi:unnamed protein product [Toxocara canis]|uniref:SERPIN domain-containing protein n=1 Tax=Toxocara canis TaxID=6265 RepID=A0A183V3U1_TOXCA|nr:unnamed protein product [Toxocara canis]